MNKALNKEYKQKKKEFKKEKWAIYGTSRSLDVALLKHYEKLNENENAHELVGVATAFKSKNIGKQVALNNACNLYARQSVSHVKGRVVSDMANNADDVSAEFDHFYAAYESLVEKEIKGEMKKIEWGSQIRSYVFMPYTLAKDHRTGFEMGNISAVMDGEIDGFINAYLKKMSAAE